MPATTGLIGYNGGHLRFRWHLTHTSANYGPAKLLLRLNKMVAGWSDYNSKDDVTALTRPS
jgi:hypothetical protein